MWNTVITLTSCGYGDIWPKSFFGHVIAILISFWGVLILSFLVVMVTDTLNFSLAEEKSYNLIISLFTKFELKKKAVAVLGAGYKFRNSKIDHPNDKVKIL
jgi:hypothetical protein